MSSSNTHVNAKASHKPVVSCDLAGHTFTARPSSFKRGRFIFGFTHRPSGLHVTVRCSGAVEFKRCLTALHRGGLLDIHGGAA
jgi:hypothetical protein